MGLDNRRTPLRKSPLSLTSNQHSAHHSTLTSNYQVESGFHAWGDVVSLLGQRTVLVAHDECLQLHAFPKDEATLTETLEFPRFHQDALQVWTTVSQPYSQAEPGRGFMCDPESEIVVINMVRNGGPGPMAGAWKGGAAPGTTQQKWSVLLVISVSALLKLIHDTEGYEDRFAFTWDEWGPAHTRFIEVPETCGPGEAPTTFGRRALLAYHDPSDGAPMTAVLDFGVDGRGKGSTSSGWGSTVLEPGTEDLGRWFEEGCHLVRSEVPCRVRWKRLDLPAQAKFMGASLFENGMVLKVCQPLTGHAV